MTTELSDSVRSVVLSAMLVLSAFAGSLAFAGAAAATQDEGGTVQEEAVSVVDNDVVFQGQTGRFTAEGVDPGEQVTLFTQDGTFVNQFTANEEGVVTFPTADLEGQFRITDREGNNATFQVVEQTLQLDTDNISVTTQANQVTFTVEETNRAGNFTLNVTSEAVGTGADDAPGVIIPNVTEGQQVTVNLTSDLTPGNFSLDVGVADTTTTETIQLSVTEAGAVTADFGQNVISDQRGDKIEIPVTLQNTQQARITVGSEEVNFLANVTVNDVDGDGNVTLVLNSSDFPGDTDEQTPVGFFTAQGADTIENLNISIGQDLSSPLATGTYDLAVSVDKGDGFQEVSVASLAINDRSTDAIQAWVVPGTALDVGADVSPADITGPATQRATVAQGDWVVVQVRASGLYGDLERAYLNDNFTDGVALNFTQVDPGPNQRPAGFTVDANDNILYAEDPANNTFFVAVPTSQVTTNKSEGPVALSGEWRARFTVNDKFDSVQNLQTVATTFNVVEPDVTLNQGEDITVEQGVANITGTTNLAPGTELTIEARAGGKFLKTQQVTVGPQGNFTANFDFADVANDTEFTVGVRNRQAQIGGVVVAAQNETVAENETTTVTENETVENETTTVAENETVENETTTVAENETTTPAEEETTTVEEETTTVEEETTTVEEETTTEVEETPEETTTIEEETTTEEETPAEEGGGGSIPGFGIGVALVALLAAALLALRRSNE